MDCAGLSRFFKGAEADEKEAGESPGALLRQGNHFCPQCGQFQTFSMALFYHKRLRMGAFPL